MSEAADRISGCMENEVLRAKASNSAGLDASVDFIGGTLGGVATVLVGQPLDTIKVNHTSCHA